MYNERGSVLCGALVWERIMPGCISVDHGARADFIDPDFTLDRGGAINVIAPKGLTSKHAGGQATSGYLAEVERVSMAQMEEWRRQVSRSLRARLRSASGLHVQRLGRRRGGSHGKESIRHRHRQVQRLP